MNILTYFQRHINRLLTPILHENNVEFWRWNFSFSTLHQLSYPTIINVDSTLCMTLECPLGKSLYVAILSQLIHMWKELICCSLRSKVFFIYAKICSAFPITNRWELQFIKRSTFPHKRSVNDSALRTNGERSQSARWANAERNLVNG